MSWAPDYVTLPELKALARITTTTDDAALGVAITTASRAVDQFANRQFGQVDEAEQRVYTARFDYERRVWVVDIDDLTDVTGLAASAAGSAITAYTLEPANAVLKGKAWTRLVVSAGSPVQPDGCANGVSVTALWGWAAVPVAVKQATSIQAMRFFARRNSPYGIAGSPDTGSELRLLSRVDPDVCVALRGLVRPRRVA